MQVGIVAKEANHFFQFKTFLLNLSKQQLVTLTTLLNIPLVFYLNYHTVLNPDAFLYFQAAESFLTEGLAASITIYYWPLYSVILGILHNSLNIPYHQVVLLINCTSYMLMTYFYFKIFAQLNLNRQAYLFACSLILLHPALNEFRGSAIRDIPFWACLMASLYYFLSYMQKPQWRYVLYWQFSLFLGFLFRVEAIVFFALAPIALLVDTSRVINQRYLFWAKLNTLPICLLITTLLFFSDSPYLGRLHELPIWFNLFYVFTENYSAFSKQLLTLFGPLTSYPTFLAYIMTGIIFIGYFIHKVITAFNILYLAGLSSGIQGIKTVKNSYINNAIVCYALIASIIIITFFSHYFFISDRYLTPLFLFSLLIAPLCFTTTYQKIKQKNLFYNSPIIITSFVLLFFTIDSLVSFGANKNYYFQAASWIKENVEQNDSIYFTNEAVSYYSNKLDAPHKNKLKEYEKIEHAIKNSASYNWVVLNIKKRDTTSKNRLKHEFSKPAAYFSNKKGDAIYIYKTSFFDYLQAKSGVKKIRIQANYSPPRNPPYKAG